MMKRLEVAILTAAILLGGLVVDSMAQTMQTTNRVTECKPQLELLIVCKTIDSNVGGSIKAEPVGGATRNVFLNPGSIEVVDTGGSPGHMTKVTEVSPGLVAAVALKVELVNGQLVYGPPVAFTNGSSLEVSNKVSYAVMFRNQVVSGKDGRDGKDGKDGAPGRDGLPGKDGRDGKDACGTRIIPDFDFAPVGVSIPVSTTANWNCTPFVMFYLPSVILPDEYRSDGKKGDGKPHTAAVLIDPTTGLGQVDYPFHPHADMMPEMPFDKVEWLPGTTSFNWWAHGQGWGVKWNTGLKVRPIPGFVVFPQ